ncbi:MAG: hypothetical protein JSW28_04330 [Thermoplasmata archaeon]|nr:MAG: hypothetical protein JSW28_04330 [Thermoplasmata archaeon]
MFLRKGCTGILSILVIFSIMCILVLATSNCRAAVSREISLEMTDVSHFKLVKTKTYSGNETGMIRAQLDRQFGNSDGYLDGNEADSFIASYNDYFEETPLIVMDESAVIKQNASLVVFNLTGSAFDTTSNVTTSFTFDAQPLSLPSQRQYYFEFKRDLWMYKDINENDQFTVDNNLTIIAPEGWRIAYTAGLLNESYRDDRRVMTSNANLDFEWISVKISTDVEVDENGEDDPFLSPDLLPFVIIGALVIVIIILLIIIVTRPGKTATIIKPMTEAEREALALEKNRIGNEILEIRRDFRAEKISKNEAKTKEQALKERLKEINRTLSAAKIEK